MASAGTKALSIAAILLGLYILYSSWNALPTYGGLQTYHIGCYHSEQRLDHSNSISFSLEELYRREQFQRLQLQKMGTWKMDSTKFSEQALNIAHKFETYAQKHSQYIYSQQSGSSIQAALRDSAIRYESCRMGYQHFKPEQCENDWNKYQECSDKLQQIKNDLTLHKINRAKIQKKIEDYLSPRPAPTPKPNPKPSSGNDDAFQAKLKAIDMKIQAVKFSISEITNQIQKSNYAHGQITISLSHTQKLLITCHENQLSFSNCETITREIQIIGEKAIQSLKQRIDQKRKMLKDLRKIIEESAGDVSSIKQSYDMHNQQFKNLLISNFIATSHSSKQCGCTKAIEQKYKSDIQSFKARQLSIQRDILQFEREMQSQNKKLRDLERQRSEIIQAQKQSITNQDPMPVIKSDDQLLKYKQELKQINHKILKLGQEYDALQKKCQKTKQELNERLKDIDKIQECLKNKHYADKLKEKVSKAQTNTLTNTGRQQVDFQKEQLKGLVQAMEL